MGLPFFWEEKGRLLSHVEYHAQLVRCRLDHKNFEDMEQSLFGKIIIEKLPKDFEIFHTFRATCAQLRVISYVNHVELRVLAKEMANLDLPTVD